jgi:hypothetical protein
LFRSLSLLSAKSKSSLRSIRWRGLDDRARLARMAHAAIRRNPVAANALSGKQAKVVPLPGENGVTKRPTAPTDGPPYAFPACRLPRSTVIGKRHLWGRPTRCDRVRSLLGTAASHGLWSHCKVRLGARVRL